MTFFQFFNPPIGIRLRIGGQVIIGRINRGFLPAALKNPSLKPVIITAFEPPKLSDNLERRINVYLAIVGIIIDIGGFAEEVANTNTASRRANPFYVTRLISRTFNRSIRFFG